MDGANPRLKTFGAVWLAEMVSAFGTQLTGFALGVWALRETGSVTWFAAFTLAASAPRLLLAPLAGALVDRHDRRRVLLFGHLGAGACSLALAALFALGGESLSRVLALVALASLASAGQYPAFQAATTTLVPRAQLARANGLVHFGFSAGYILAPLVAGLAMADLGLAGILALDALTFSAAIGLLMAVRVPRPQSRRRPARFDLAFGWRYLRRRPPLMALLALFASLNFCLAMAQMLLTPLALSVGDERTLGLVLGQAGLGMLLGSLAMVLWGGSERHVALIGWLALAQGALLALTAFAVEAPWLAAGALLTFSLRPMLAASSSALWQRHVEPDVQGRVFATRSACVQGALPLAYVSAGPLADGLLEPWMAPGALGARLLGPWLGSGPGRGVALLLVALGIAIAVLAALACRRGGPLRALEGECSTPELTMEVPCLLSPPSAREPSRSPAWTPSPTSSFRVSTGTLASTRSWSPRGPRSPCSISSTTLVRSSCATSTSCSSPAAGSPASGPAESARRSPRPPCDTSRTTSIPASAVIQTARENPGSPAGDSCSTPADSRSISRSTTTPRLTRPTAC
ncbi:MAG: MFS transporter [Acidobacteriota bacterium]